MRRLAILIGVAILFFSAPKAPFAQDKILSVPARFQGLGKTGRLRLTGILGTPELHATYNPTTAFSADGKRAIYVEDLTTGPEDKPSFRARVLVWDVEAKNWPREFDLDGKNVTALVLSADGGKALLAGQTLPDKAKMPRSYLGVLDLQTGKHVASILAEEKAILAIAWGSDENTVLTGTADDLKSWDLKKGKSTKTYTNDTKQAVTALAMLPGGKRFLAGQRGGEVRLFDADKEKHLQSYKSKGDHQFVWHLAVAKDGKRFVAADFQASITLWDIGGKEVNTLPAEKRTVEEIVTAVALAPDGKTVLSTWAKANPDTDDFACARLVAWDADANKTLWSRVVSYRGRVPLRVNEVSVQVGGGPNLYQAWSLQDGNLTRSVGGHKSTVNVVGALAGGDVISGGQEGAILTWQKGELARSEKTYPGAITALALSAKRDRWLTAGADQTICHWPPSPTWAFRLKKSHTAPITSLAFSTDGKWGFSGSGDRTVKTWNLVTSNEVATLAGHSEGVNAVAVSPDDRWLASGSDDTTIKVWPIKDAKVDPDREAITLEKHTKAVTCLAFSPDGKRLLSGSQDQELLVWDWKKGGMDFKIPGHKNWITSILLLDATTVLTASDDLTVAAWNLADGMEIGRIDFGLVGDCPRCLAQVGPDRFLVGTSSWLIYEFQLLPTVKTKGAKKSSNK